MTYGTDQEETARALNDLIVEGGRPDHAQKQTILDCRRHAVAACRERLVFLGGASEGRATRFPRVATVATQPLQELFNVVATLTVEPTSSVAPSDLLPGPPADQAATAVDRWRCAARSLVLANHELTTAGRRPWVARNESLWHLTGDIAAVVEAIVVLDQRLEDEGLLPRVTTPTRTAQRLVTGDVARLARWFGTDDSADLTYASPLTQLGLYDGPRIHMVRRPEDLATAQRTLAAFLRPRRGDLEPTARAGIQAARVLSVGQVRLAETFAGWAEREHDGSSLPEQLHRRIPAYLALHRSTVRLVETIPAGSPLPLAQQSEMNVQLKHFRSPHLSRRALLELNEATHDVAVTLGSALRREGMHRKNILVQQQDGMGLPRPRAITNSSEPFQRACKALTDDPAPIAPDARWAAPVHRERLRSTLDRQPTATPPPIRRMPVDPIRQGQRGPRL